MQTDSSATPRGQQLTIVAFVRAKPGQGDELGRRLQTLVVPARAEPGNINYDLLRSNDDPDVWVSYENWRAESDLATHFEQQYMKDFVATATRDGVIEGQVDLRRLSMITTVAPSKSAA
jgi:quinol monooxygenase YgiN